MLQLALANLRHNVSRLVATLVAIAIGIGFLLGGGMLTDALSVSLGGAVETQFPTVDLVVEYGESFDEGAFTLPSTVTDTVRDVAGVDAVAGEVQAGVAVRKGEDGRAARVSGRLWIDDGDVSGPTIAEGRAPEGSDEILVDAGTAESRAMSVGDEVTLTDARGNRSVTIVGVSTFGGVDAGDPQGTVTLAADQHAALGVQDGTFSRLMVDVADDASIDEVQRTIAGELAEGVIVGDREQFVETSIGGLSQVASILRGPLLGFSFLALAVCGFVIANTYAAVLGQRTRELGLIRAIAATPWQVSRSVWLEAIGLGLLGSVAGIGVGVGVVVLVRRLLDRFADIRLPGGVALAPRDVIIAVLLGTLVPLCAVTMAAFRAGRTPPIEAMRSGVVERPQRSWVLSIVAVVVLALGVVLLVIGGSIDGVASGVLLGIGALTFVIGLLTSGRILVRGVALLLKPLARTGVAGRLATDNLARNPKRTASTANALVIGVSLIALVSVIGSALKGGIVDLFGDDSSVDFNVVSETAVPQPVFDELESIDGVETVLPISFAFATIDNEENGLAVVDTDLLAKLESVVVLEGSLSELGDDGVAVVDPTTFSFGGESGPGGAEPPPDAESPFGAKPVIGNVLDIVGTDGTTKVGTIRAILEFNFDLIFLQNVVSPGFVDGFLETTQPRFAVIDADDAKYKKVGRAIDDAIEPYPTVEVTEGNVIAAFVGDILDILVWVVNGLLGMSVAVAVIGIINTMALSIYERRRELGLLRAVGMTSAATRRMVGVEAFLISLIGTVIGIGGGLGLAVLLLRPLDLESTSIPWSTLGYVGLAGMVVGLFSGGFAAWRVSRLDILESLQL